MPLLGCDRIRRKLPGSGLETDVAARRVREQLN
ncbi:hypothetical protein FBZ89_101448 [Nitrospirillum amazonense]|uniref:Uncharacterized protein n=1 Tax=Nitrospirillum amazonense TaxID=28077 RepID=A0A560FTB8_9PROT|nr:hypothetical protein FBZ89_101448 [Nitrospirillum amazonense]